MVSRDEEKTGMPKQISRQSRQKNARQARGLYRHCANPLFNELTRVPVKDVASLHNTTITKVCKMVLGVTEADRFK